MSQQLFATIEAAIPTMGGWTTVQKAQCFASIVLALKPSVCCELGVWNGRGSIAIALALKEAKTGGVVYAVDAWSAEASSEGQVNEADAQWWNRQQIHEDAYKAFQENIQRFGVANQVNVVRSKSQDFTPPKNMGLLIVDGNHGPAAVLDVERYAPNVYPGGFCYLDDLGWSGGAVREAETRLISMGFRELYTLDGGAMYQRVK